VVPDDPPIQREPIAVSVRRRIKLGQNILRRPAFLPAFMDFPKPPHGRDRLNAEAKRNEADNLLHAARPGREFTDAKDHLEDRTTARNAATACPLSFRSIATWVGTPGPFCHRNRNRHRVAMGLVLRLRS
jgi:hypothetical protein